MDTAYCKNGKSINYSPDVFERDYVDMPEPKLPMKVLVLQQGNSFTLL